MCFFLNHVNCIFWHSFFDMLSAHRSILVRQLCYLKNHEPFVTYVAIIFPLNKQGEAS